MMSILIVTANRKLTCTYLVDENRRMRNASCYAIRLLDMDLSRHVEADGLKSRSHDFAHQFSPFTRLSTVYPCNCVIHSSVSYMTIVKISHR